LLGHGFAIPTQTFTHSLQALVFASQSPYSGLQTVFNNRNVMRHLQLYINYYKMNIKIIFCPTFTRLSAPSLARGLYPMKIGNEEK
jgi:hypothetical protein